MADIKHPKKLRILCLHGYNNTIEIMRYQMVNFAKTFDDLCEFTYIQGTWNCIEEPLYFSVSKGVQPPYKRWFYNKYKFWRTLDDGTLEYWASKAADNFEYQNETLQFLIGFLNIQDEPFDGFIGFSQGVYVIDAIYRAQQYFSK